MRSVETLERQPNTSSGPLKLTLRQFSTGTLPIQVWKNFLKKPGYVSKVDDPAVVVAVNVKDEIAMVETMIGEEFAAVEVVGVTLGILTGARAIEAAVVMMSRDMTAHVLTAEAAIMIAAGKIAITDGVTLAIRRDGTVRDEVAMIEDMVMLHREKN